MSINEILTTISHKIILEKGKRKSYLNIPKRIFITQTITPFIQNNNPLQMYNFFFK